MSRHNNSFYRQPRGPPASTTRTNEKQLYYRDVNACVCGRDGVFLHILIDSVPQIMKKGVPVVLKYNTKSLKNAEDKVGVDDVKRGTPVTVDVTSEDYVNVLRLGHDQKRPVSKRGSLRQPNAIDPDTESTANNSKAPNATDGPKVIRVGDQADVEIQNAEAAAVVIETEVQDNTANVAEACVEAVLDEAVKSANDGKMSNDINEKRSDVNAANAVPEVDHGKKIFDMINSKNQRKESELGVTANERNSKAETDLSNMRIVFNSGSSTGATANASAVPIGEGEKSPAPVVEPTTEDMRKSPDDLIDLHAQIVTDELQPKTDPKPEIAENEQSVEPNPEDGGTAMIVTDTLGEKTAAVSMASGTSTAVRVIAEGNESFPIENATAQAEPEVKIANESFVETQIEPPLNADAKPFGSATAIEVAPACEETNEPPPPYEAGDCNNNQPNLEKFVFTKDELLEYTKHVINWNLYHIGIGKEDVRNEMIDYCVGVCFEENFVTWNAASEAVADTTTIE